MTDKNKNDALEKENIMIAKNLASLADIGPEEHKLSNDDKSIVDDLLSLVGREVA